MIPVQMGALEQDVGNHAEDGQRDTLLDDLQLNEVEGTTVLDESNSIGRNLAANQASVMKTLLSMSNMMV